MKNVSDTFMESTQKAMSLPLLTDLTVADVDAIRRTVPSWRDFSAAQLAILKNPLGCLDLLPAFGTAFAKMQADISRWYYDRYKREASVEKFKTGVSIVLKVGTKFLAHNVMDEGAVRTAVEAAAPDLIITGIVSDGTLDKSGAGKLVLAGLQQSSPNLTIGPTPTSSKWSAHRLHKTGFVPSTSRAPRRPRATVPFTITLASMLTAAIVLSASSRCRRRLWKSAKSWSSSVRSKPRCASMSRSLTLFLSVSILRPTWSGLAVSSRHDPSFSSLRDSRNPSQLISHAATIRRRQQRGQ